jgi:hypothetical protein
MNTETLIRALETELTGYIRRGLTERANLVRQELIRLGCPMDTPSAVDVPSESDSTPTKPATRVRKAPEPSKPEPVAKAPEKKKRT